MSAVSSSPRVLIVSRWEEVVSIARLPRALSHAGFSVGALCTDDSFLAKTRYLDARFTFPKRGRKLLLGFLSAFREWNPDLILPGNDWDLAFLQRLASSPLARTPLVAPANLMDVLERSLGDLHQFGRLASKRTLQDLALELGIRTPEDRVITGREGAFQYAEEHGYPVVLKHEFNSGGTGVWICEHAAALQSALDEALRPAKKRPFRRMLLDIARRAAFAPAGDARGSLSIQRYIHGKTIIHNFVALNGQRVAGVTAENLFNHPAPTGPCSVVRPIENAEVNQAACAVVQQAGYSGFGCFDFILEEGTNAAYLLECNTIPCNVAHVGDILGSDLCAGLYATMTGTKRLPDRAPQSGRTVALFPQELRRDAHSANVMRFYHDVPADDPELLDAYERHFNIRRRVQAVSAA